MPSFFELAKRLITGEQAFQAQDNTEEPKDNPATTEAPVGPKNIPQVAIVREDCRLDGSRMVCYAHIENSSAQSVYLDDVTLLGVKKELQTQLDPGERREFQIYNNQVVHGNFINECFLLFRNEEGDYFRSMHDVDCEQQPDGPQLVKRIRFIPPVKDV